MDHSRQREKKKPAKQTKSSAKRSMVPQETNNSASPMNTERLRRLYATMLKCRLVAERCAALFGADTAAATGHEAAEVGACIHLREDDLVSPTASLINGNITKGATVADIFAILKPSEQSVNDDKGNAGSLSSLDLSHQSQIQASTMVALSNKLSRKPVVNVAIINMTHITGGNMTPIVGRAETSDVVHRASAVCEEMSFWERSVHFAGARKLGIVYLICTAADSNYDLRGRALSFHVPGITVDGNDVVAVYRVAEESVRRAREGHGPTLIDCKIVPARDPLTFMEGYLKKRGMWSDKWHAKVLQEIKKELDRAI
jgi:acetoin:2,6-dichlorophenolindophenol oxidoreductase subunit alpha